ncbi:TPA: hypothetical protein HA317_04260 [Candidatus Woesearchaeota archaeon]|nr:hypothetical protein [Candidatus Woesearchaeota archaeon]
MTRVVLPGSFMIIGMFGFVFSAVYTMSGRLTPTWGFTFCLTFLIMFIASVVSITPGEV